MAIITITRQVAALGDEIAKAAAEKLGYSFYTRKQIEDRIVELGFPAEKLAKYDERKPGFFASLSKGRDEYLNYLQYAVIEAAQKGNCILIGRGAFVILENLPNLIPLRFIAKEEIRIERLMKEFNWNEKQAKQRIDESAANRSGFHKSFFNVDDRDPEHFMLTINTGIFSVEDAANQIETLAKNVITAEKEDLGKKRLTNMLKAQELVNRLLFEYKININFLHASLDDESKIVTLQGVADSQAIVDRAVTVACKIIPDYTIKSAISVVQDFKTYQ
ncbi:MAG: cytidylate kinase-like family protein [Treponema sp.]|nr:cytidylate kinase-like family protein [Treponema sp.]